jgi:4-hydroxy-tetrahydrodipicolinate synthase
MTQEPLTGIIAAPFLPMLQDARIDWTGLERYMDWIAAARPCAIAMNMDASEGPSLDRDEQIEVVRVARAAIAGRCQLFSGLIANATEDAARWGGELVAAGADGLAVFPPFPAFLGSPLPARMVSSHYAAVGAATGVPLIAFRMRWVPEFDLPTLEALARIPELVGIKDAMRDTGQMIETIAAMDRLPRRIGFLTGNDPVILDTMLVGGDGALIGFAGTATDRLLAMHRAVESRDIETALGIWRALGPLARHCWRDPVRDYRPRMKEVLVMQGLFRTATVRAPQPGIGDEERRTLRRLAAAADLLDEMPAQAMH